uniref:Protoporphyrinogen oxidase n=1 Tax=Hirondellea gigas TaxID=1518452 RepID=A0A6A7FRL0_9CRUS
MPTIAVLGGGITGLSAAYYLKHLQPHKGAVILFEASSRLGGWINSEILRDGTRLEIGPRTLRATGAAGANSLAMAHHLGLENKIIPVRYGHPTTRNRMIQVGGELHTLPSSLKTAFQTTPPFSKPLVLSLLHDLRAAKVSNNDESLYSFVNRRFGSEVADYIIDPLTRGVFAGNARELSVKSLGKVLHEYEQTHGGVVKGALMNLFTIKKKDPLLKNELVRKARTEKWAVWSMTSGIGTLVDSLTNRLILDGVEIRKNSKVDTIKSDRGKMIIKCGSEISIVDHIISCLSSKDMSSIVGLNFQLKSFLEKIPFVTVGVVNLVYEGNSIVKQAAFGYLVPSSEPSNVLGVIFDTCAFPQENKTVLTVMMGGYWFNSLFGYNPSKDVLLNAAILEVHNTLHIKTEPCSAKVSILQDCIPQYVVGHTEAVENARQLLIKDNVPMKLAGNSYDGVGVNDSIMSARNAVMCLQL